MSDGGESFVDASEDVAEWGMGMKVLLFMWYKYAQWSFAVRVQLRTGHARKPLLVLY